MIGRVLIGLAIAVAVVRDTGAQTLPSFKIAARDNTAAILLVPAKTTEGDLVRLLGALRDARRSGTLGKFLPPTTPRAPKGPYQLVVVFIMSDPTFATDAHLKSFSNPTTSTISAAEKAFGKRILAEYYFTAIMNPSQEFATIGYEDEGHQYTGVYKKVF